MKWEYYVILFLVYAHFIIAMFIADTIEHEMINVVWATFWLVVYFGNKRNDKEAKAE